MAKRRELTPEERAAHEAQLRENLRQQQKAYRQSEKGKLVNKRYDQSEKGRAAHEAFLSRNPGYMKEYNETPEQRAKQRERRQQQKQEAPPQRPASSPPHRVERVPKVEPAQDVARLTPEERAAANRERVKQGQKVHRWWRPLW